MYIPGFARSILARTYSQQAGTSSALDLQTNTACKYRKKQGSLRPESHTEQMPPPFPVHLHA